MSNLQTGESLHGLNCPRCGGMVPVPEGVNLVICPYCSARSVVSTAPAPKTIPAQADAATSSVGFMSSERDELEDLSMRAIRRYQVPLRIDRDAAASAMQGFLGGRLQIARDCAKEAQLTEALLVHLPFWSVWGRGVAWGFGQQKVGSGDNTRYEPREKRAASELAWNAPACDVGEFGVRRVELDECPLEPFDPAALHRSGMVFEPVGSAANALEAARSHFEKEIRGSVEMSRTEQVFTRLVNTRLGLVYHPLWVLRYLYRGRAFQVVVNGFDGSVQYGKAPGSVAYRAGMLVGGMALGALLALDVPVGILYASRNEEDSPFIVAVGSFLFGVAIMYGGYRTFRHAEHYEYHRHKAFGAPGALDAIPGNLKLLGGDLRSAVRTIEKLQR